METVSVLYLIASKDNIEDRVDVLHRCRHHNFLDLLFEERLQRCPGAIIKLNIISLITSIAESDHNESFMMCNLMDAISVLKDHLSRNLPVASMTMSTPFSSQTPCMRRHQFTANFVNSPQSREPEVPCHWAPLLQLQMTLSAQMGIGKENKQRLPLNSTS